MLQGGWIGPAMQTLTGAPYFDKWHEDTRDAEQDYPDEIWNFVDDKLRNGWLVCASSYGFSDEDTNDIGVINNHGFTVLDTVIVGDGIKLYKMKNPHAFDSYFGPWSDDSELWDETLKK